MLLLTRRIFALLVRPAAIRLGVFPTSVDGVAAAAITVPAAAVAWTTGAWTQIVLAAGVLADTLITGVSLENFVGAASQGEVWIGVGTAPLGTEIARIPVVGAVTMFPRAVWAQAGVGIVAKYRTSTGVADTVDVKLLTATGQ